MPLIPFLLAILIAPALASDTPQPVAMTRAADFRPRIIDDATGGALAVWQSDDGTDFDVLSASFRSGAWSSPTRLSTDQGADFNPAAASSPDGSIVVVWITDRYGDERLVTRRRTGDTWGAEILLGTPSGRNLAPDVIWDGSSFRIFWYSSASGGMDIYTSGESHGGWTQPQLLFDTGADDRYPDTALAPDGTLWLTWTGAGLGNLDIYSAHRDGSGWSLPMPVEQDRTQDARSSVEAASDGTVWIVWDAKRDLNSNIYGSMWTGTNWSTPTALSSGSNDEFCPRLTRAADNALAMTFYGLETFGTQEWQDDNFEIYTAEWTASGWSPPERVTENGAHDFAPDAVSIGGTLHLVWESTQYGWDSVDILHLTVSSDDRAEPNLNAVSKPATPPLNPLAPPIAPRSFASVPLPSILNPPGRTASTGIPVYRPPQARITTGPDARCEPVLAAVDIDSASRTIAADPSHHRIRLFDPTGAPAGSFGAEGSDPGLFRSPFGVCVDDSDRILVADTGNDRIQVFDSAGTFLFSFGSGGDQAGQFRGPRGVDARVDRIAVADSLNHRIQVFDSSGAFLFMFGAHGIHEGELNEPWDVCIRANGDFAVANTWGYSIARFDASGNYIDSITQNTYGPSGVAEDADGRLFIANTAGWNLVLSDPAEPCTRSLTDSTAFSIGPLFGVAVLPSGHPVFTAGDHPTPWSLDPNRPTLIEAPRIEFMDGRSITIAWHTAVECPTTLFYGPFPDTSTMYCDAEPATEHRVELTGLDPLTRYKLRPVFRNPFDMSEIRSDGVEIVTLDTHAETLDITAVKTCILVYRDFCFWNDPLLAYETVTDAEIEGILAAADEILAWYHRNSAFRLHLPHAVETIEGMVSLADGDFSRSLVYTPGDLLTPWPQCVERDLIAAGIDPARYDNFITFFPFRCYAEYPTGIFSWGCASDLFDGRGFCAIPHCWPDQSDWFILHEGHHSLDGMLASSGFPAYPHADLLWENNLATGLDRDANARIVRSWPASQWRGFRHPWSLPVTAADLDQDGISDEAPTLPFDEARFGSDSTKTDTDLDGLPDLDEALAGIGIPADPTGSDTDHDSIPDGADMEPLYPIDRAVFPGDPQIDGVPDPAWHPLIGGHLQESSVPGFPAPDILAAWSSAGLYLAIDTPGYATYQILIDAAGDGWYHGHDNYEITVHPVLGLREAHVQDSSPEAICEVGYSVWDDASEYPFPPYLVPGDLTVATAQSGGRYTMEMLIPADDATSLTPREGKSIRLLFRMNTLNGSSGQEASVFERDIFAGTVMQALPPAVPSLGPFSVLLALVALSMLLITTGPGKR